MKVFYILSKSSKKDIGAVLKKHGVEFRVWAPFASSVAVTGSFNDWAGKPMASEGDGYWWAAIDNAMPGQEYKYVITNGQEIHVRNDPRALQFTTSAGNSIIVDPSFDWGENSFTPPPVNQQVIYELHIGTFAREDPSTIGTFRNAADKLDYLANLGVNMIEIMPISNMLMDRGWGYATDYIFAVESLYGGRHQFLEFVKSAHNRGIGIILDVVYNHFGPDNSLDLWQFDGWNEDGKGGIYFYNDWRSETPWGSSRPDFGRTEVQQYILDNVKMCVNDCRVDGIRVDSTIYIRNAKGQNNNPDTDLREGWELLQKINTITKKINPAAITIAEDVSGNDYITKPTAGGGAGFNAQWETSFPSLLRSAILAIDPDVNFSDLSSKITSNYNNDPFARVIYSDSHDSAANGSSRLIGLISPGKPTSLIARKKSLIAAAIVLTTPGIPMLFQGQEFMETGSFNDWQELDWDKAEQFGGIVEAHKHLIALRKNAHGNTNGLTGKSVNITNQDNDNKVLIYHRWDQGGPKDDVLVVINFGSKQHPQYETNFPRNGTWRVRFNSSWKGYSQDFKDVEVPDVNVGDNLGTIVIPANSVLIFSQD